MLAAVVPALAAGAEPRRPQDHARATWCARRTAEDGLVDWSRGAREVWTFIRAVGDPYPGAFTFRKDRRLTLWSADWVPDGPWFGLAGQVQALGADGAVVACGAGYVRLRTVQLEGGPRAPAQEVLKLHERLGLEGLAGRGGKAP
jgi:methionyl-tRNA formyltransferase